MAILKLDSRGQNVVALQQSLKQHNFAPGLIDGDFGPGTEAAVIAFQKSEGLLADGIVGIATSTALGLAPAAPLADITARATSTPSPACSQPRRSARSRLNLPFVLTALRDQGLGDKSMVLMALATIRAEVASFEPISEGVSASTPRQTDTISICMTIARISGTLAHPTARAFAAEVSCN